MIHFFLGIPSFIKVGFSFSGILLLNRAGCPLGLAILLSSLVLSLWSGTGIEGLAFQASTFAKPENYLLPFVIALLLFFTEALTVTGRINRTVEALKNLLKNKKTLFIGLPALIGLLPMPGGAVFSAPLVASVDTNNDFKEPNKVAINYWFRHIWEYWWPMYPGVILAIRYSGLSLPFFLMIQMPFTLAALWGGYFFILKKTRLESTQNISAGVRMPDILAALGPILILVVAAVVGSLVLPASVASKTAASLVSMLIGLLLATSVTLTGHGEAWRTALNLFRRPNTWLMILLIISLQVFSATLKTPLDGSGATIVGVMRNEFLTAGIPLTIVIMLIPFISGLVTGVAFGFVGASFPLVFALIGSHPPLGTVAATTTIAYAFGYMGMMLSPMHVCFVVTCEYFQTSLARVYLHLAGPILTILFTAFVLSGLYYLAL